MINKPSESPGMKVMIGEDLADDYVAAYVKSHQTSGLDYNVTYMEYLLADHFFDRPYTVCITACGTLGYAKLFAKASRIDGIELSRKMIEAGRKLNHDAADKIRFIQADIRAFPETSRDRYDFVDLNSLGFYFPVEEGLIEKYFGLVNSGGLLLIQIGVTASADLIGRESGLFRMLYHSLARLFRSFVSNPPSRVPITISEANRRVNRCVDKFTGARVVVTWVSRKLIEPSAVYHVLIQKEKILSDNY